MSLGINLEVKTLQFNFRLTRSELNQIMKLIKIVIYKMLKKINSKHFNS